MSRAESTEVLVLLAEFVPATGYAVLAWVVSIVVLLAIGAGVEDVATLATPAIGAGFAAGLLWRIEHCSD